MKKTIEIMQSEEITAERERLKAQAETLFKRLDAQLDELDAQLTQATVDDDWTTPCGAFRWKSLPASSAHISRPQINGVPMDGTGWKIGFARNPMDEPSRVR